jgi:hypothetical protein
MPVEAIFGVPHMDILTHPNVSYLNMVQYIPSSTATLITGCLYSSPYTAGLRENSKPASICYRVQTGQWGI